MIYASSLKKIEIACCCFLCSVLVVYSVQCGKSSFYPLHTVFMLVSGELGPTRSLDNWLDNLGSQGNVLDSVSR